MKYLLLFVLLCSCIHTNIPDPSRFRRDYLYCWVKNTDNNWYVKGDPSVCPLGTVFQDIDE